MMRKSARYYVPKKDAIGGEHKWLRIAPRTLLAIFKSRIAERLKTLFMLLACLA